MRVALIDGAVNMDFLQEIKNSNVRVAGVYAVCNGKVTVEQQNVHEITHASVCAGIFLREIHCPCELLLIRVLDADSLRGNIHALVAALDFCIGSRIDVINLSLGTSRIRDAELLQDKVSELTRHHMIIVAAESNRNQLTFPAAFENVIGVRELTRANRRAPSDSILYRSKKRCFSYQGKSVMTGGYNSYAAPAVTARVCDCLAGGITEVKRIKRVLLRQRNIKKSRKRKRGSLDKPVICLNMRDEKKAAGEVKKILHFFASHGYEGVCISDTLQTDYAIGILNIWQFQRILRRANDRFWLLTNTADVDFVIWHAVRMNFDKRNRRSIDRMVTDGEGYRRMPKADELTGPLDGDGLKEMLKSLT
ncbi:MAG: S8 family serine peptidase [Lachnospiraceae bacterium]|nr:S8 family serine peptidase [Lachnospiraceae bacterium]MBD5481186.1 S8 family serine peptidase [Lachnospiraceae bacterium]